MKPVQHVQVERPSMPNQWSEPVSCSKVIWTVTRPGSWIFRSWRRTYMMNGVYATAYVFIRVMLNVMNIWWFPEIGVPTIFIHFNGIFPHKPSIWGYPMTMETTISLENGNTSGWFIHTQPFSVNLNLCCWWSNVRRPSTKMWCDVCHYHTDGLRVVRCDYSIL